MYAGSYAGEIKQIFLILRVSSSYLLDTLLETDLRIGILTMLCLSGARTIQDIGISSFSIFEVYSDHCYGRKRFILCFCTVGKFIPDDFVVKKKKKNETNSPTRLVCFDYGAYFHILWFFS